MLSQERQQEIALLFLTGEIFNRMTVLGDDFPAVVQRTAEDLEIAVPELMVHVAALMEERMNKLFSKTNIGGKTRSEKEEKRDIRVRARQGAIALLVVKRFAINDGLGVSIKAVRFVENASEKLGISFEEGMDFYIGLVNESMQDILSARCEAIGHANEDPYRILDELLAILRPRRTSLCTGQRAGESQE
jgi:hypothetical protein